MVYLFLLTIVLLSIMYILRCVRLLWFLSYCFQIIGAGILVAQYMLPRSIKRLAIEELQAVQSLSIVDFGDEDVKRKCEKEGESYWEKLFDDLSDEDKDAIHFRIYGNMAAFIFMILGFICSMIYDDLQEENEYSTLLPFVLILSPLGIYYCRKIKRGISKKAD